MEPLHARLARVGLAAASSYGFVLAGGYAVQAHGFLERISDDVDLFTGIADPVAFSGAVDRVATAYRDDGFTVDVELPGDVFARFTVIGEAGRGAKVEMGCDWRFRPSAQLDIGPVLHPDDAAANKVTTLFGRARTARLSGRGSRARVRPLHVGSPAGTRRRARRRLRSGLLRAGSPSRGPLAGSRVRGPRNQ